MSQTEAPHGWQRVALGNPEYFRMATGGTPSTSVPGYWGGTIRWMNSGDVHRKRIYDVSGRITERGYRNSNATFIPKDSVLVALAGQGKTRGTVAMNKIELTTNQSVAAIIPNHTKVHSGYLYHYLDDKYLELRSISAGAGRAGLSLSILGKYVINIPMDRAEQEKISSVIQCVDEEIVETNRLIDKHKKIKDGLMEDLLSEGVSEDGSFQTDLIDSELGKIPKGWTIRTISDIAIINPAGKKGVGDEDKVTFLAMDDISEEGRILRRGSKRFKDVKHGFSCFSEKDVIFAKITPCMENGKGAFAEQLENGMGCGSTEFHVLRAKPGTIPKFLYYVTMRKKFRMRAEANMTGTAGQQRVQGSFFGRYKLAVPGESEQKRIAKRLELMDRYVLAEEAYLEKLTKIERGLSQDLLTGKVRVTA